MNLAFAATMIRPRYLRDSIVARKGSASAFLHSLDPKQTVDDDGCLSEQVPILKIMAGSEICSQPPPNEGAVFRRGMESVLVRLPAEAGRELRPRRKARRNAVVFGEARR